MVLYAHLQEIIYVLNVPIASKIIWGTNSCFILKVEATCAKNLLTNSVPLSDKIHQT